MRLIFIVRIQLICNAESLCLSTLLAETTTKFKVINAGMLLENLFSFELHGFIVFADVPDRSEGITVVFSDSFYKW